MPARKYTPDFTACTQFGLRYSTLGKRIAASEPYHDGENPREVTSTMNLYELCEALDIELTEEQAEKEAEYIYENRRQYYKNHPYMEKKAIAKCYDGPVFPDDVVYRRSNCEKYTVRKDGSIVNTSGTVEIKTPNWEGFVHTAPKKHEKVATFTKGMPRKTNDKSPALTLPKQDNPLVKGEYKTRTPEEESRAKAKQREQARKEAAKTAAAESEDERIIEGFYTLIRGIRRDGGLTLNKVPLDKCEAWLEKQRINTEGDFARGYDCGYECCLNSHGAEWFEKQKEPKQEWSEAEKAIVKEHYLGDYNDADLVEELRRRGYEVTATKTINL